MGTDKIARLINRLELVKSQRDNETPDALSVSLWAMGAELSALDEAGRATTAEALGITPDDVREMARTYTR